MNEPSPSGTPLRTTAKAGSRPTAALRAPGTARPTALRGNQPTTLNPAGTLLEDCSPEFRARFAAADLVIAKGQGNYESLVAVEKPVFFLLNVKCSVVSGALGCPIGSLVVHQQRFAPGGRPAAAKPERSHSPSPRRPSPGTEVLGLAP